MWNENAPLELLENMPNTLNEDNLKEIQKVIDIDKYKNSAMYGCDLCGAYAPFCEGCNKSNAYPCAVSYIKMKQAEGMQVKIETQGEVQEMETEIADEPATLEEVKEETFIEQEQEEVAAVEDLPLIEEQVEIVEEVVEKEKPKVTKIRIAIARKKHN